MSRRSRKAARKRERNTQRDIFISIASRPAAFNNILQLEDRRLYEPVDDYPRALFHRSARLVVGDNVNRKRASRALVPSRVKFNVPQEVALCVRRKQRREVLFAKRRTGKGSRARRRRRTYWSNISC